MKDRQSCDKADVKKRKRLGRTHRGTRKKERQRAKHKGGVEGQKDVVR